MYASFDDLIDDTYDFSARLTGGEEEKEDPAAEVATEAEIGL